ncbi:MAG TPA: efflux RND transporter periplasmic adaptor subunit [Verrucomicrobiae bacterium]|nr:efflux RND transporter periplasmic adaptor subunit [Verrucomicrobiae bacterium]
MPTIEKEPQGANQEPLASSAPPHGRAAAPLRGQGDGKPAGALVKRMLVMLVIAFLFIGAIGAWKVKQIRAGMAQLAAFAPPPTAVTTTVATRESWQPVLSAVGSLRAVNGVTVSTDLAGIISQISFQSGTTVKKGDLLVKLDSRQEEAQLRSAEARRDWAKISLDRQRSLVSDGAVSKSDYDQAETEYRQANAAVDDAQALIARKTIKAPFDGVVGIRQVDLGQYLNVGAPIVALQSLDPIYVEFAFPQQNLDQIVVGKALRITAAGVSGEKFDGEITAIDSQLDGSTRNVTVQGTIKNPQHQLLPGMFVNVEVLLPEQEAIFIPASSVSYAPYGNSVFVVKNNSTPGAAAGKVVEQQFVKLGPTRGDQVTVVSGVKEGDVVVSSGVFELRSGAAVQVNNSVQPGNEANPNPPNM